jgi:hypothetical protein
MQRTSPDLGAIGATPEFPVSTTAIVILGRKLALSVQKATEQKFLTFGPGIFKVLRT